MGFDRLYNALFVAPFSNIARLDKNDVIDSLYRGFAWAARMGGRGLPATESGKVRWYVLGLALGALIFVGIVVFS